MDHHSSTSPLLRVLLSLNLLLFSTALYAQESGSLIDISPKTFPAEEKATASGDGDAERTSQFRNVNIDAELMYGQYNNIFSAFSIIQSNEQFTYQLNTEFKRSNDFGYTNSSFYDNSVEFTGQTELLKNWTFIPIINIYNESHGMFDNAFFSREEKDKIVLLMKNEYKPSPTRWQFNYGGAQYVHRLVGDDALKSSFNKFNEEIEWDFVFSASHQLTIRHYSWVYFYNRTSSSA
jgi:hypothetical protein